MDQILVQKKKIIQPNQKKRSTYKNVQPTIQIQPIKNMYPVKIRRRKEQSARREQIHIRVQRRGKQGHGIRL